MLSSRTDAIDRTRRVCAMTCAIWLLSTPTFAQGSANQSDRCQAPDRQQSLRTSAQSDAKKLADCKGVLKPPSTGDSDFVVPAPPTGDTPVIPPGQVPQKQQ